MPDNRDTLVEWLRDAHAMEKQAATVMDSHADRLKHYPQLKALLEINARESKLQAARLEQCLKSLGSDNSSLKDLTGKVIGMAQTLSGYFAEDEVVKGVLALYTFKHMEIGSYRILVGTAQKLGEKEVASVCGEFLDREMELADELEAHLDDVSSTYLERERMLGAEAGR